jgi:PKD domain
MTSRTLKTLLAAALATAGVAAAPSIASADTFCVNNTCDANNFSSLQAALDAAAAHPGFDHVQVAPPSDADHYTGPFTYTATGINNDVEVFGTSFKGEKPRFLRGGAAPIFRLTGTGQSSLRNLRFDDSGGPGTTAIDLKNAGAVEVDINGNQGATGATLNDSDLEHSNVFMGPGRGAFASGPKSSIQSSIVSGDTGAEESGGELVIDRSKIQGGSAGVVGTGDRGLGSRGIDIRSSVVATSQPLSTGVSLANVEIARILRSTIVGTSTTPSSSSAAISTAAISKTTSTELTGAVLDGFGRRLKRTASGLNKAHLNVSRSEWLPTGDQLGLDAGAFTESGNVHADPLLIDPAKFDARLRGSDKAVDLLGSAPAEAPLDFLGRVTVDGNGDGILKADAGALEYQRIAPVLSVVSMPEKATTTTATTFSVKAKDADGEPVTIKWNFGDGTPVVTGQSVTHQFTKAGDFNVIVTGKDSGGLNDSKGVTVTVSAP